MSIANSLLGDVLDLLDGAQWRDEKGTALCPIHDDDRASLSFTLGDKGNLVFHCFAGCEYKAIEEALIAKAKSAAPIAVYPYCYADGKPSIDVLRKPLKIFLQRRHDPSSSNGNYVYDRGKEPYLLYRLPKVLATDPEQLVVLVGGEKDVESLEAENYLATTNCGGEGNWNKLTDLSALAGRDVLIVPDRDRTGQRWAQQVWDSLQPIARNVTVLYLPYELTEKHGMDISDWFDDGNNGTDLEALIEAEAIAERPELPSTGKADQSQGLVNGIELTDAGNAVRLWREYGDRFRWVPQAKRFIVWDGAVWQDGQFGQVQEWAKASALDLLAAGAGRQELEVAKWAWSSRSQFRVRETIASVQSIREVQVSAAQLDICKDRLATLGGTYNLRTGTLEAARPEDYFTQAVPVYPQVGAPHPKWTQYLKLLFKEDVELIAYFRRLMGSWLTGSVDDQCFYILFGDGDNGKSTLLILLSHTSSISALGVS